FAATAAFSDTREVGYLAVHGRRTEPSRFVRPETGPGQARGSADAGIAWQSHHGHGYCQQFLDADQAPVQAAWAVWHLGVRLAAEYRATCGRPNRQSRPRGRWGG